MLHICLKFDFQQSQTVYSDENKHKNNYLLTPICDVWP